MKKNTFALTLSLIVFPAYGAVDIGEGITLYGEAHMASDNIKYIGNDHQEDNFSMTLTSHESHLGLKAERQIDTLHRAYIHLEGRVTGNKGDYDNSHIAYVGLESFLGRFEYGAQDSYATKLWREVDLFANRLGSYRALSRGLSQMNDRIHDMPANETFGYVSPAFYNLRVHGSIVADQDITGNTEEPFTLGLQYEGNDNLTLGIAYSEIRKSDENPQSLSIRAGLQYRTGAFTLALLADSIEDELGNNITAGLLGGEYAFGKHRVKAQINTASRLANHDGTATLYQVGYDYVFDKQARIYALYSQANLDDGSLPYNFLKYDGDFAVSFGFIFGF